MASKVQIKDLDFTISSYDFCLASMCSYKQIYWASIFLYIRVMKHTINSFSNSKIDEKFTGFVSRGLEAIMCNPIVEEKCMFNDLYMYTLCWLVVISDCHIMFVSECLLDTFLLRTIILTKTLT